MRTIVDLYRCMAEDERLQHGWEHNQSRHDRCIESPLISRVQREVATAALAWIKLGREPAVNLGDTPQYTDELLEWAVVNRADLCKGGPRLVNVIRSEDATEAERSACVASLTFYRDRSAPNPIIKREWSAEGLRNLGAASAHDLATPKLKLPSRFALQGAIEVAQLLLSPPNPIMRPLPKVAGVGDERSDAIGVFGFRQGWPITDENLWRLCAAHGVLTPAEAATKGYNKRRKTFQPHWEALRTSHPETEVGELAARLYLWANEASRYGFQYW